MGGYISSIADLAVLSTTISVDLELADGDYMENIYCAAFKAPSAGDSFDWQAVNTVKIDKPRYWDLNTYTIYEMPDITIDASGQPIQPGTDYKVKCGVKYVAASNGVSYLSTEVKTPAAANSNTCETGVKVNGVDAPKVLMAGQSTLTLSGLEWSNFHPAMLGMHAYEVPTPVPAMSTIEMKCCGGEECEFFFALYNCVACTGPKHGGLAETLLLDEWDAGACSPQFGDGFKTTAFHKNVHAIDSDVYMTYTAGHDEIMAMFGLEGSISTPWCARPHGPSAPAGAGCGTRCPEL